ncbi:nuclear transport factor 2 family protein [Halobaculum sp. CBA1158]|uniref:nuclear transport factor 2 family protein n=1 Tax=Halobaculum sp. CBA1158 TaxID=2904243 RepID=UPI001F17E5A9|nr:nuclear transport factor 2 family protein [Halobaculum sp. CBA1158]UIO99700.1 nuclear transport factor 2 family protein [Halobaculum sp. CBA1158]
MTPEATARAYYEAIDAGEYDALAGLLAPDFVHDRPDRTLSGRERFVRFMRDERPRADTDHRVDAVHADAGGEVLVRGRLVGGDGAELFGFVDVFRIVDAGEGSGDEGSAVEGSDAAARTEADGRDLVIADLRTYTN